MVEWGSPRFCEAEREAVQNNAAASVPPPFLVYKRRLYVLAKKPPVLDHRQADLDSIFGTGDETRSRPARPARPPARTAIHAPAARRAVPNGQRPARTDPEGRPETRPRFVPREI